MTLRDVRELDVDDYDVLVELLNEQNTQHESDTDT